MISNPNALHPPMYLFVLKETPQRFFIFGVSTSHSPAKENNKYCVIDAPTSKLDEYLTGVLVGVDILSAPPISATLSRLLWTYTAAQHIYKTILTLYFQEKL